MTVTEAIDFSEDPNSPTVVTPDLEMGTNFVSGSVSAMTWATDVDYFQVVLPPNSRLASVRIKIENYASTEVLPTSGYMRMLPEQEGNSGMVTVSGNNEVSMSFTVGNPNNIILHAYPPFITELGSEASYDYQVQLVVAPLEFVADTAIHKAVEITFPSESGTYYQLQCTSDLNSDTWVNLGGPIRGEGGTMSSFDTTRLAPQRFYRVVKH